MTVRHLPTRIVAAGTVVEVRTTVPAHAGRTTPGPRGPSPTVITTIAAALLVLLTACGAGATSTAPPPPASNGEVVRRAVTASRDAGPAAVTLLNRTSSGGQDVDLTGDGVLDLGARTADVAIDLPSLGGRVRVLFVGGVLYAALPPQIAGFVNAGRPWVSVDVDRLAQTQLGAPLSQLGVSPTNPADQLAWLQAVRDDARLVGPEPIDGTPTTHYAAVVDLDRVPAAQDPAQRPAIDRLKARLGTAMLPVDVWIDPQGRLRRVSQTLTTPAKPGIPPTGATTTLTFTRFGATPVAPAPPSEQVSDLSRLLGSATPTG